MQQSQPITNQRNHQIPDISISRDRDQKTLKREYGSMLASSFKKLSGMQHTFCRIERRLTKPVRQEILDRLTGVEAVLTEVRQSLEQEDFYHMQNLASEIKARFQELDEVLHPQLEQLQYQVPYVMFLSRHEKREFSKHRDE